jgi:hypothetical protein
MNLSYKNLTKLPNDLSLKKYRYFNCSNNKLTTLEGGPKEVFGYYDCQRNKLTTLEDGPKEVGNNFHCSDNKLITLEGPEIIGGNFYCYKNPNLSLKEILKFMGKCKIGRRIITDYGDLTEYKNRKLSEKDITKIILKLSK